jgi:YfiR/HmsC-like
MPQSRQAGRVRIVLAGLAVACTLGAAMWPAAATEAYSEDAVKAAFLYRFTGYVDWPPQALSDAPFTIAVFSADGVAAELGRLLQNRQIQNRSAQVKPIKSIKELDGAQMLYIGASHREDLRHLIAGTAGRPVLVVSSEEGGLDGGSAVNFLLIDRRVRFEISLDAAESSGLKVASELLAVAIRVRGKRLTEAGCDEAAGTADLAACIREAAQR